MNTSSYRASVQRVCVATAAFAAIGMSAQVGAATTGDVPISATIAANCVISTTAGVAFGTYDSVTTNATAPLDATGSVSTICTVGTAALIRLDEGLFKDASSVPAVPVRRASNGTDMLSYALYSEATHTTVWGNTTPTGLAETGIGTESKVIVYGRVPAGQVKPVGIYVDTVTASVDF